MRHICKVAVTAMWLYGGSILKQLAMFPVESDFNIELLSGSDIKIIIEFKTPEWFEYIFFILELFNMCITLNFLVQMIGSSGFFFVISN